MLVLLVAGAVASFTPEDTLRCVSTFSAAGRSAAIHMVLTGGDGVRTAAWRDKVSVNSKQQYTQGDLYASYKENGPMWES